MQLKGSVINFLGDSITAGYGLPDPNLTFWGLLAQRDGVIAHAYGISGTRIAPQRVPSEDPLKDLYFKSRVQDMDKSADAVVVFGGTNDFEHGDAPLGKFGDQDESTFYGALCVLCKTLLETFPRSEIIILTPLHRMGEDDILNKFGQRTAGPLCAYVDAIIKTARLFSLPLLDLYAMSGINPGFEPGRVTYAPDGLHPNEAGHERIYSRLKHFLEQL